MVGVPSGDARLSRPPSVPDPSRAGPRRRVLITGGAGLVGRQLIATVPDDVEAHLTWRNATPPTGATPHRVDLTRGDDVDALVAKVEPDVVVHTAYSMHDRADIVTAAANVVAAAVRSGSGLVHLSTDVVFDGNRPPYVEADPISPVNEYGRWKALAEAEVRHAMEDACITRTSLVISLDPPDTGTRQLADAVAAGMRPTLFGDEIRCPIRVVDLASALWALVDMGRSERAGVWHLPGPEPLTRLELGQRVLAALGLDPDAPRAASARDHPDPRPPDLTLRSTRGWPGAPPRPVDD